MWEEGVSEWYQSMVHPLDWMGGVLVTLSCWLHICVLYACGLWYCCICMVVFIVAVMSPCGSGWCVVVCGHHECMSVMHLFCISMFIYCYTYIDMVVVVMHEAMMLVDRVMHR